MKITGKQIAMARILLDLSQEQLAKKLGIVRKTVMRIENGQSPGSTKTHDKIQTYFENKDIIFTGENGVNRVSNEIKRFKDQEGFDLFYQDFYETLETDKREVYLNNSQEQEFEKYFGNNLKSHIQKILALGVRYKILIPQNDSKFMTPEYAEYRWMPKAYYSSIPFFVYGNKLAIFIFKKSVSIIVIDSADIANAYRAQFKAFWTNSIKPPAQ